MRFLAVFLGAVVLAGVCHADTMRSTSILLLKKPDTDLQLIDFNVVSDGEMEHTWLVVGAAEAGKIAEQQRLMLIRMNGSLEGKSIDLFSGAGWTFLDAAYAPEKVVVAARKGNQSVSVQEFNESTGSLRTLDVKLDVERGYILSALLAHDGSPLIYLAYVNYGLVKIALIHYETGASLWDVQVTAAHRAVGSVIDMVQYQGALVVAGAMTVDGRVEGWLGKITDGGGVSWETGLEFSQTHFAAGRAGSIAVVQHDVKGNKLIVFDLGNVLAGVPNGNHRLTMSFSIYRPVVGLLCDGQYLTVEKEMRGGAGELSAAILRVGEKGQAIRVALIDNGTIANYLLKIAQAAHVGYSVVYVDSDRMIRSGVELSRIEPLPACDFK